METEEIKQIVREVLREELPKIVNEILGYLIPEEEPEDGEKKIIEEAEKDFGKGEYISLEDFLKKF